MSEQILRNPKSMNCSGNNFMKKNDRQQDSTSMMTLTKIKNPLTNKKDVKQDRNVSTMNKNLGSQKQRKSSNQFTEFSKPVKKEILQQPSYRFYADKFNLSSDDSYFLDQSVREQRKQKIEKEIIQKFKNSRKQIESLLRKSREQREQRGRQQIEQSKRKQQKIQENTMMIDKKQVKRSKLKFYHCDSIIVKPQFHPTKVFQLAITPTTHYQNLHKNNKIHQKILCEIQPDESFESHSKYDPVKKQYEKNFFDSFNESPLDKLNDSKHHFDIPQPSFLDEKKQRSHSNYEKRLFVHQKSDENNKKIFLKNHHQHEHQNDFENDSIDNRCRTTSDHQGKSGSASYFDKNSQETIPTYTFKRRNKIFSGDKKSGLKLSRAIIHQEEINKLKGEMGVDVFHIIIQQDEFLRQCCT